ncbi:7280_t:CDS:2, partial [Dentiscutata erythropus]
ESVAVKLPTRSDYFLEIDPLTYEILPKECKYEVLSTKIEVKPKLELSWVLEGVLDLFQHLMITYPSLAHNAKNWDKMEKEINKDQEKLEGEVALNSLFQQLYRDADDDTKRAMLKSYTKNSDTCLSTNWS